MYYIGAPPNESVLGYMIPAYLKKRSAFILSIVGRVKSLLASEL
jgi:hypothetical protein